MAKLFDPVQTLKMTETWRDDGEGGCNGDFTIDIDGQPITISADFELYPTDDGCCYRIEHRVKARVPLIGGRLEKYVLGQTLSGCEQELDYLRDQLDQA
jgi:hypothetical protein